jgi:ABC-type lipoprotein release transport system permease subunit
VFVVTAMLLLMVAVVACMVPAWQASRLDPMTTLRMSSQVVVQFGSPLLK